MRPAAIPLRASEPADAAGKPALSGLDTLLPHWGPVRRAVHGLCRRSRALNTIVAALEMRLGRDELLSLPQYMALCPTGQCNAMCGFCSVTTNRTGIIKKQLPFDALSRFTAPVSRTIRMYGLEGNGEPTLYDRFDELADTLLRHGATGYLITNGERLTAGTIDALVRRGLDAVNFSVNAATAATHRRVMKLRDFDRVLQNIRQFVQARNGAARPTVSMSMVVTRDNIHEVVDFIRLAEVDLEVDQVLIRPLSEIATDIGPVEDGRALVPFESEVNDMLDGVRDYLGGTPRRARVEIAPDTFRAVRPDPPGAFAMPPGEEDRLYAPRPAYWAEGAPDAAVEWAWNAVSLRRDAPGRATLLDSAAIPVLPGTIVQFRCDVVLSHGALSIAIGPPGGEPIVTARAETSGPLEASVPCGPHRTLALRIESDGMLDARLTFDRLRTPAPVRSHAFLLPHAGRWEVASPDVRVAWKGSRLTLEGQARSGPYLVKSYSAVCAPATRIVLPLTIRVHRGAIGIGVLSGDQQQWLETRAYGPDAASDTAVSFETGSNQRVHLVVYGAADGDLHADIDWGAALEPEPARLDPAVRRHGPEPARAAPRVLPLAASDAVTMAAPTAEPAGLPAAARTPGSVRGPGWLARVHSTIRGPVRYYCQKPWTDLHNFSVDGRMDVCCIATGESQTRYGLGNLLTQSFQEVWNGPTAREFRRTVNSGSPLPPCRRCPMAFAYQGPLFNPDGADRRLRRWLGTVCRYLPLGSRLYPLSCRILTPLVSHTLFRGFKRT